MRQTFFYGLFMDAELLRTKGVFALLGEFSFFEQKIEGIHSFSTV
jgi:hypothetical protein